MDRGLLKLVREAALRSKQDLESSLMATIIDLGGEPLTVRRARDGLSTVLRDARSGKMQVIGRAPEDMTVVVSLRDLAELVSVASKPPKTFGEALDEMGFRPAVVGRRIIVGQGHPGGPLTRYRAGKDKTSS